MCVCLPDISYQWMLLFLLLQQTGQVSPHTQCIPPEILLLDHVQDGQTDGTRHRVTAKLTNSKPTQKGKIFSLCQGDYVKKKKKMKLFDI